MSGTLSVWMGVVVLFVAVMMRMSDGEAVIELLDDKIERLEKAIIAAEKDAEYFSVEKERWRKVAIKCINTCKCTEDSGVSLEDIEHALDVKDNSKKE